MNTVQTKNSFHGSLIRNNESKLNKESKLNNNELNVTNKELTSKFRHLIRESDINFPMSDELLMCFIRARKHDLHRALKLLKNYFKMVKNYPELFTHLLLESVKHVLDRKHLLASPVRDQHGRLVVILNARNWDYRVCGLEDVFRCIVLVLQRIVDSVENQSKGVVLILDFKDFALHQVKQFTPAFVKKIADLIQDVFPIRFMGLHVVNEPWALKILVTMIWPFLSHKIRNRLFFHGQNFDVLHKQVDPSSLPSDFDGWIGPMENMSFLDEFPEDIYSGIFDCFN